MGPNDVDPEWRSQADDGAQAPFENEHLLMLLVARVLELGRGPVGLVDWLQGRVDREEYSAERYDEGLIHRLTAELAEVLRRGLAVPLAEEVRQTIRTPQTWVEDAR